MEVSSASLENRILGHLPGSRVQVEDLRGDAGYFVATVTSAGFAGKSLQEQHRMVYAALGDALPAAIRIVTRVAG